MLLKNSLKSIKNSVFKGLKGKKTQKPQRENSLFGETDSLLYKSLNCKMVGRVAIFLRFNEIDN